MGRLIRSLVDNGRVESTTLGTTCAATRGGRGLAVLFRNLGRQEQVHQEKDHGPKGDKQEHGL